MDDVTDARLHDELASFQSIWQGGYFSSDPLDPLGWAGPYNYISVPHAIYQACIAAYVDPGTVALEIGPGRGAWTRGLLPAREVWVIDALSDEHNGFWDYVGRDNAHVTYEQVSDFSLAQLPDDHFTYLFSFDALCHVSFEGITQYMSNLRAKLKDGAECFVMVADYAKYNRFAADIERYDVARAVPPRGRLPLSRGQVVRAAWSLALPRNQHRVLPLPTVEDDVPAPGRWYDAGVDRTCALLRALGYKIVSEDVGLSPRDPIIHFRR
jgi:hypothetical protein